MSRVWFIEDLARFNLERRSLTELERTVPWLQRARWRVDDAGLSVEFAITIQGKEIELILKYGETFPFTAPIIVPKTPTRLSEHQYQRGPLCLEWGPDNWITAVTGAQLIESAFKLLSSESPGENGVPAAPPVPTRHYLTQGQELRSSALRYLLTPPFERNLPTYVNPTIGVLSTVHLLQRESSTFIPIKIAIRESAWSDPSVPQAAYGMSSAGYVNAGLFAVIAAPTEEIIGLKTMDDLKNLLQRHGLMPQVDELLRKKELRLEYGAHLIVDVSNVPHLIRSDLDGTVIHGRRVRCSAAATRTPDRYDMLNSKQVGIVGLGSLGSKVALSLARAGVRHFYLVDQDIFLPENIERHVLDWNSIAEHKVAAMADALQRIHANVKVETSALHLTGQENSKLVDGALTKLAKCDLIIDLTADATVFNLLAGIATSYSRVMIWAEVFEGGIGGLIGRSRPKLDPSPLEMRNQLLEFCDSGAGATPPPRPSGEPYDGRDAQGNPVVAADPNVSTIASMAADISIDSLLEHGRSEFPVSMYLIGLRKGWIFSQPFEVVPIKTDHLVEPQDVPKLNEEIVQENFQFLVSLVRERSNDGADAAQNQ